MDESVENFRLLFRKTMSLGRLSRVDTTEQSNFSILSFVVVVVPQSINTRNTFLALMRKAPISGEHPPRRH